MLLDARLKNDRAEQELQNREEECRQREKDFLRRAELVGSYMYHLREMDREDDKRKEEQRLCFQIEQRAQA